MMPPPSAAEVHSTSDFLLGFFVGKNAKKSPPKIGEEPYTITSYALMIERKSLTSFCCAERIIRDKKKFIKNSLGNWRW